MLVIRRIGVLSLAKFLGILYGGLGLIFGLLTSGFSLLGIVLGGGNYSSSSFSSGEAVFTLGAVVCFPILYGIGGFIGGIITALIANLALKFSNGLEVEADAKNLGLISAPPEPQPIQPMPPLSPLP
jgi:hypothetical protein